MALAPWLVFLGFALPLSWFDLTEHRLPNRLVAAFTLCVMAGLIALGWFSGDWQRVLGSILAGIILSAGFACVSLLAPRAMGMGDAKLMFPVGICLGWIGWPAVWWGLVGAFVIAGFLGLMLVLLGRRTMNSALPFGPFLLASVPICQVASAMQVI
jgi:leader peptidase (prepilin peptidase) / N-methyltransferase